jgi:hypothetical protein
MCHNAIALSRLESALPRVLKHLTHPNLLTYLTKNALLRGEKNIPIPNH